MSISYSEFLNAIKEASNALESTISTLDNALPVLDFILEEFEKKKAVNIGNSLLVSGFTCWAKLDKYYTRTTDSSACCLSQPCK